MVGVVLEVTFKHGDSVNKPDFDISTKSKMSHVKQNGTISSYKHHACNTSSWNTYYFYNMFHTATELALLIWWGQFQVEIFPKGEEYMENNKKHSSSRRLGAELTSGSSPLDF